MISDDTSNLKYKVENLVSQRPEKNTKKMALHCESCTNLSVSLKNYQKKCSKLLSIILNDLNDAKQDRPSSNQYVTEFLEKIKIEVTDYMVDSVNDEMKNEISKLVNENEILKLEMAELQTKNKNLEDQYCTFLFENAYNL